MAEIGAIETPPLFTAKDPYRGTPPVVRIMIRGIVLVDVHIIVITVAVHGVASYMTEPALFGRGRNRGLLTEN